MLAHTHSYLGTWAHSPTPVPTHAYTMCRDTHTQTPLEAQHHTYTSTHTNTHNLNSHPETKPTEWMPETSDERLTSDEPNVGIPSEKVLLWPLVWPSRTWFQRSPRAGSLVSSLSRTQAPAPQHCHQDGAILQLTAVTGRSLGKYNNIPSCL